MTLGVLGNRHATNEWKRAWPRCARCSSMRSPASESSPVLAAKSFIAERPGGEILERRAETLLQRKCRHCFGSSVIFVLAVSYQDAAQYSCNIKKHHIIANHHPEPVCPVLAFSHPRAPATRGHGSGMHTARSQTTSELDLTLYTSQVVGPTPANLKVSLKFPLRKWSVGPPQLFCWP